ncbi:DUF3526 domain-containing protein [Spirosoma utsteinense]|uniref:ABC-2 type transport system permease protein n=1 Tax=Spirosoma utsteinense TaxID=2585773 RepID=A0ABR6WFJ8_9BACT|nr:DUF3526 domain-containing protein [Spirosoma utsteinense]MBC3789376.1 ABC-2 type transport system permease protein [Spirosoma utsteinense]MBC3795294.1 ABC-2 type transport system permease protein [Spirosoma utsteinense]
MKHLFEHEFLLLKQSKVFLILIVGLLLVMLYSLTNGRSYYQKQIDTITELKKKEADTFSTLKQDFSADTTTKEGNKKFWKTAEASLAIFDKKINVYWTPSPLSVLSIGNRDIFPYYQEILPISLYMRLFKNEISNPVLLLSGSIDFSYVIIFLVPLLLIALTFNLVSYDQESRISALIDLFVSSRITHYGFRFLFYLILTGSLLGLMFGMALLFLPPGFSFQSWATLLLVSFLYGGFWLGISFVINMAGKSSIANVSLLLCGWLLFTVLIPSVANQYTLYTYPVQTEKFTSTIQRVQLTGGESEMREVLSIFYRKYPQYKAESDPEELLFSRAYLAKGQLNDEQGDRLFASLCKRMDLKNRVLNAVAFIDPAMYLQHVFCQKAQTDLADYLSYVRYVQHYNSAVKDFYFKRIYSTNILTISDYENSYPCYNF